MKDEVGVGDYEEGPFVKFKRALCYSRLSPENDLLPQIIFIVASSFLKLLF